MNKSDKERLRKIVSTWESLSKQMKERNITPEQLLNDEFSQWAVTTPLYNIGERVYQLSDSLKKRTRSSHGIWLRVCGIGLFMIIL